MNILVKSFLLSTVVAGRAKPQQPSQQSGRTALSGKQEGVREEGDGHRGAELGGRLRGVSLPALSSPSPSLHHPSTSVSHFYLIKRKKQNSIDIRRTQVPPLKKLKKIQRTTKPECTLAFLPICLRKQGRETNLISVFLKFTFVIA